jgi:putative tryptophan/tyrosine transport system substrate-binding protein
MRRREFIALMGASAGWPFAAGAQQALPTVGVMSPASPTTTIFRALFPKLMKELGWEENRDYRAVFRFAEGHVDRFPVFTEELLAEKVNVIIALSEPGIQAAQRATKTVPIVGIAADMIRTGLAASMARPGGNLTGVNVLGNELDAKRLEILHEAVPAAKRIGALALPARAFDTLPELEAAARQLSLELVVITVRSLSELTGSLDALQSPRVDAINVLESVRTL